MTITKRVTRNLFLASLPIAGALALVFSFLSAAPTAAPSGQVVAVPWQGSELLAHQVYSGGSIVLQAVATRPDGTAMPLTSAVWDAGDGSAPVSVTATNGYTLELNKTYTGALNTPFTATITVTDTGGNVYTDTFKVVIGSNSRETKVNMAIDKGLWNLHKSITRVTLDGLAAGYWTATQGASYDAAPTASSVQAFEINNHRESGDPLKDPYATTVKLGIRGLLSSTKGLVNFATATNSGNTTDSNGNGFALQTVGADRGYVTGQVVDALVASGTPNAVAETGAVTYVRGRTYKEIVKDMLDGYAMGMNVSVGGWHYELASRDGVNDVSASHWWGIAELAAQTWGVSSPAWVKTAVTSGFATVQSFQTGTCVNSAIGSNGNNLDGHFGYGTNYDGGKSWLWDGGTNTTAAGLIMINATGGLSSSERFTCASNYLKTRFTSTSPVSMGNFYTMYQTTKAMRTALDTPGHTAPITMLGGTVDWYAGYADFLVTNQNAAGQFSSQGSAVNGANNLSTSWGVIILSPSLFDLPPSASCTATPATIGKFGGTVTFDASASFHPDANATIASYSWNFGDGTANGSGVNTTHAYAAPASFPTTRNATVTVTDSRGTSATASCPVTIVNNNVPPSVAINGPYTVCAGSPAIFTANASDEDGTVNATAWDINSPINFAAVDGTGASIDATAVFAAKAPGTYDIGFRATDDNGAASSAFSTVTVLAANNPACNQPPTISVPADILLEATSPAGAVATFTATAADDHDTITPVCTPPSGSTFGINPTTSKTTAVQCTATDSSNLSASGTFNVTVQDTTPPVITIPADITVHATSAAGAVVNYTATAADIVDTFVPVVCTRPSGVTFQMGVTTMVCTATDLHNNTSTKTFLINVTNAAPIAVNDAVTTHGPVNINVLANDTDADGDALTVSIVTGTVNGSVFVQGDKTIRYLPNGFQANNDSFTYQISDGRGGNSTATVAITVTNAAPTPQNDTITLAHNVTTFNIPVLVNDSDPDGDTFTVFKVFNSGTCHCNPFVINGDGTVTYSSASGPAQFTSPAQFTYTIRDQYGRESAPATVTVIFANQAPTANQIQVTTHGQPVTVNLLTSANDPDGDTIALVGACGGFNNPSVGVCNFNVAAGTLTFTPHPQWFGPQIQLGYTVTDGHSANASNNVRISYVNQLPVAGHPAFVTTVNTPLPLTGAMLLAGSSDPDGDALTIEVMPTMLHGTLTNNGDDTGVYTPNPGFIGIDTMSYDVDDQHGGVVSTTATITVTAPTVTTITAPSVVYGNASVISINVASGASSSSTGVVTLVIDGTSTYNATLNNGIATVSAVLQAGPHALSASYGGEGFFLASTGVGTHEVTPAPTTTTVVCTPTVIYNGAAQDVCTANVSGFQGVIESLPVTYANNTNTGTASASATYAGTTSFLPSTGSATFQITPATTTTVVTCSNGVYTGAAQENCSASVTGAGALNQTLTVSYANNTDVGTATGSASYAGDANHDASNSSATFQITPATTTTVVTCSNGVYTGAAQENCSASVTGAGGLNQTLTVSYANNTNVGTATGSASYAADANHTGSDASATFEITPATSTTVVTCSPMTTVYNGFAQALCTASVTGVGGLNQTLPVTYSANTNVGTATGSATYAGDNNHDGSSASATFEITKAAASCSVTAYSVTYDTAAHTATGSCTGVRGESLAGLDLTGTTHTNAGSYTDAWTFTDVTGNYSNTSGSVTDAIAKAPTKTTLAISTNLAVAGAPVTLTATVVSVLPGAGIPNGTVTFTEGATVLGTSTVNASGIATLMTTTLSNGPHTIAAAYSESANFLPSASNTVSTLIYGFAAGGGTFVISDTNATMGKAVSFWGAQWEKNNVPSGGKSNASFKGFAMTPAVPTVGATFTSAPGNSVPQPSSVPQYIGIIVTSKVTKSGSSITGTIVKLVVVKVDAGYVADPGHAGTGTIVAFIQ